MQHVAVGVRHHVAVIVHIHFRSAQDHHVHHGREIAFPVIIVAMENGNIRMVRAIFFHRAYRIQIEGLGIQHIFEATIFQHFRGILGGAANGKTRLDPA